MGLRTKQSIFVFNIAKLITFVYSKGYELTFGEAFRTPYQQAEYVRTGLSKTNESRHLIRMGIDFNVFKDGVLLFQNPATKIQELKDFLVVGDFWLTLNTDNVWGGDWNRNHSVLDETFRDPYHFEMKP